MKKWLAVWLALALLFGVLAGCGNDDFPPPEEKKEKDSDGEVLRVVTNLDYNMAKVTDGSSTAGGTQAFGEILRYFSGTPSGIPVEPEILPIEESALNARLTSLRTEIMAGKGPDVYLLSSTMPEPYARMSTRTGMDLPYDTQEQLFPNPEHAMHAGFFLRLDDYIENARHMQWDKLTPAVMEAGRTGEGQFILPMYFKIPFGLVYDGINSEKLPGSWDELVASEDRDIKAVYYEALGNPGFRTMVFGKIADNKEEELLITEEELLDRTREAFDLWRPGFSHVTYHSDKTGDDNVLASRAGFLPAMPMVLEDWRSGGYEESATLFAPRNTEGGVTAQVSTWCAVNANTEYPEDAFSVVDMFMSKEFLSLEYFWTKHQSNKALSIPIFGEANADGIPVHEDLLKRKSSFKDQYLSTAVYQAQKEAREQIGYSYIPSNVDQEVDYLFREIYWDNLFGEELDRRVEKCYSAMKMMIEES